MKTLKIRSASPQEIYDSALRNGCTPKLAEMLGLRSGPAIMTDAVAFGNRHYRLKDPFQGLPPRMVNKIKAQLKKAGVNVLGKKYISGLARKGLGMADPEAWVEPERGAVRKVLEKRGWSTLGDGGMVTVKPAPVDVETTPVSAKKYRCDKRLVVEDIQRQVEKNPALGTEIKHNKKFAKDFFHKNHLRLSGQG